MYLNAEKYISQRDYTNDTNDEAIYNAIMDASNMGSLPTPNFGGVTVSKCVGYWRKANAIHGWFVRELADGVDECQRISVGRGDLIRLRDDCVNALAKRNEAVESTTTNVINLTDSGDSDSVIDSITKSIYEENVKSSKTIARTADPLEPTEGFFFGGTDKDDWYYSQLEYTVEMINAMLANDSDMEYEYYYRASW